jgi:hypothetical protein
VSGDLFRAGKVIGHRSDRAEALAPETFEKVAKRLTISTLSSRLTGSGHGG